MSSLWRHIAESIVFAEIHPGTSCNLSATGLSKICRSSEAGPSLGVTLRSFRTLKHRFPRAQICVQVRGGSSGDPFDRAQLKIFVKCEVHDTLIVRRSVQVIDV